MLVGAVGEKKGGAGGGWRGGGDSVGDEMEVGVCVCGLLFF